MNRRLLALVGVGLLLGAMLPLPVMARAPEATFDKGGVFIVQLKDKPVIAYTGGTAGIGATAPVRGQKLDPAATRSARYAEFLRTKQDTELAKAGGGKKLYSYVYAFNGFAARLTAKEANRLAADPDVRSVTRNEMRFADTSSTPDFLKLTKRGGLWDELGGPSNAGADVIIGIIDSGIWPESLSFSDRVKKGKPSNANNASLVYTKVNGWHGRCVKGEAWNKNDCNRKLIGARWFNEGMGGDAGIAQTHPWEYNSARDYNGHGSHTASTAGGNYNTPTNGAAAVFGPVSGMAPKARIAVYKALWSTEAADTAGGTTVDLVAAIDQAVADGVDVINYSISGTSTDFADPVEIAFLFAADAGIFVAQSAGNSGPATSTVAHPGPWTTTVAAGTHNRDGQGSVTLGNGTTYEGASVAAEEVSAPLVDASSAALPGEDPAAAALCFSAGDNGGDAVLDPAKVAGRIVVCDRGVNPRINKSLAVEEAGGVGVILVNTSPNSINADFHFIPTVHLQNTARAAVKAYAATAGAGATIHEATVVYNAPAPFTAAFSSRGPLRAGGGDLLKPDLIAPGQDILAAVSPVGNHNLDFSLLSGTSMSSPHVAGLAALLIDKYPRWSPMAIKSALMTTAGTVEDGPRNDPTVIFRQGAGHVAPNKAIDPGLVFDAGWLDWLALLCGTTDAVSPSSCTAIEGMGYSLDPSDYNGASIAIGDLAGSQTVTRTVTNVDRVRAVYRVQVKGLAGLKVAVKPALIDLRPGQSKTFTVKFTRTSAALNTYAGGQLIWSDGDHKVRVPVVVQPVALSAPPEVHSDGEDVSYGVTFGYNGAFTATGRGLVPAALNSGTVADDPSNGTCSLTSPNAQKHDVAIPAGTTYARFSTFDADVAPGSDIDLCVFNGTTQVGSSGTGTSEEEVNLSSPAAGTYTVVVHGWEVPGSSPYVLHSWVLGSGSAGNMTVTAPATASTGATGTIGLSFSGLTSGTKYLGSVVYGGVSGMPAPTIVRVDP